MKNKMKVAVVAGSCALVGMISLANAGSVMEDAKFILDLRGDVNGNDFIDAGEVGSAVDFSAQEKAMTGTTPAYPLSAQYGSAGGSISAGPGYDQSVWGVLPQQETMIVTNAYYPYTAKSQTCLHFYQSSKKEGSATYWAMNGITFPRAAVSGAANGVTTPKTIYVRFKWEDTTSDPNVLVSNGSNGNYSGGGMGQTLYLNGSGSISMSVGNGTKSSMVASSIKVTKGQWCDVFATTENIMTGNVAVAVTEFTVVKISAQSAPNFNPPTLTKAWITNSVAMNIPQGRPINIGCMLNNNKGYQQINNPRAFKGAVSDVMIWNRVLTDEEKIEVMAGWHGAKWMVGIANGTADEFNDGANASVAIAETYEPQSMAWCKMRKTLDAENPTLTLKSPLAACEVDKPMILTVVPILSGTGSNVPVEVEVNGTVAGVFDLAQEQNFIIRRKYWKRDSNGNVTVSITRTDTAGRVSIDALALSGSWQIQEKNGIKMLDKSYAANHYYAGDPEPRHAGNSFSVGAKRTAYNFGVWVPAGMGAKCGWNFHALANSRYSDVVAADRRFTLSVNGAVIETIAGVAEGAQYKVAIPAGTLQDGLNLVEFRQTEPSSGTDWQYYGHWGMDMVPLPDAFVIMIR